MQASTFVGLDVSKDKIAVSVAEAGRGGEVRYWGTIAHRPEAVRRLVKRLAASHRELRFCYEAGPCGYGLYRQLNELGQACVVVAPSLIPTRPGDRIKTDRRDATMLAKLHRADELVAVWVPDATHEAMRDLVRARAAAGRTMTKARQQLQGFLLRHDRRYPRHTWNLAYRRWLSRQRFPHAAQQLVLEDAIQAVEAAQARVRWLEDRIAELLPAWSLAPLVEALQAMRGIAALGAVTLVAEIGDFTRFRHPSQLMAYLGLVPSEFSSGNRRRQGHITKAGNGHARRVLIEGAWTYRLPARIGPSLLQRQQHLSQDVQAIAWKAQVRLCSRYRRMTAAGKLKPVVVTAIAREMAAFVWAIARQIHLKPAI